MHTGLAQQLRTALFTVAIAVAGVAASSSHAADVGVKLGPDGLPDRYEPVPEKFRKNTDKVAVSDKLGQQARMDLQFTDTAGRTVKLGDYFGNGRPVVLQMGYFRCPQICDVVSAAMIDVAKKVDLDIGKDYDVLYVSIDPKERWQLGQQKKTNYVAEYARPGAVSGMNFLVGTFEHIDALAQDVGFSYQKVDGMDEFAHPSMLIVLTPEGKVSRYLYGVQYSDKTYKMALLEAGKGQIGDLGDQLLMMCFHWDEHAGMYTKDWMRIMRAGGALTVLILGTGIGLLFWREHKARARRAAAPKQTTTPTTIATA